MRTRVCAGSGSGGEWGGGRAGGVGPPAGVCLRGAACAAGFLDPALPPAAGDTGGRGTRAGRGQVRAGRTGRGARTGVLRRGEGRGQVPLGQGAGRGTGIGAPRRGFGEGGGGGGRTGAPLVGACVRGEARRPRQVTPWPSEVRGAAGRLCRPRFGFGGCLSEQARGLNESYESVPGTPQGKLVEFRG